MNLLEALVALVILGASAVGFLGVFQSSAHSVQSASDWNRASAAAGSAMEEAVRALKEGTPMSAGSDDRNGVQTRVDLQPWSTTVEDVVVRASLPDGRSLIVHRLVRHQ